MIPNEVYSETLLQFLSPVRKFLDDPTVTELMINGPDAVYIERRGRLERTDVRFASRESVMCALRNAAQFVGKHVDEQHPILEARLPDGSRVQAVIPPIATDGPYVSIRRFSQGSFSMERMLELEALTPLAAQVLEIFVQAKLNMIVAGGTGSGKTSMLNTLTQFVPAGDRIVVIEDSKEVQVQHPHVVYMEARPADLEGRGAVTIRDLFRATLRLRPDRIIIGEIRAGEALDIVQAMVSGHGGCLGTLHATYPRDTLTRLETMAMMSDVEIPLVPLRLQIASGINVIVQVSRLKDGTRKLSHITEVVGFDIAKNQYLCRDLFVRRYRAVSDEGRIESEFVPTGTLPLCMPQLQEHGLDLPKAIYDAHRVHGGQDEQ
jgi:pilus assembly protein CpaF